MAYASLAECVRNLEKRGQLRRVTVEVDPHLEIAEIQRRLFQAGAPAVLFTKVKGTPFPVLANLYGTRERVRFLFRHTLAGVEKAIALKFDPSLALKRPFSSLRAAGAGWHSLPMRVNQAPVLGGETTLGNLPHIVSWPLDGGAYVTLPQVYTEHPDTPGWRRSNLGMYRIQLSGKPFAADREVGLHYQIHRGIGPHHQAALRRGERLRVNIFVGGPPAHALAAIMPLPEDLPELLFAGMMAGRRFRYLRGPFGLISADADFCISGTVDPARLLPEGPFGDHLGYYSLAHPFPVLEVDKVYHRSDAIWPFTVVGRPPQEDSCLSELIHEFAGPALPHAVPGLKAVHAVEAAGVHPLLLAIGSERYVPYEERKPRELLTIAHAVLGYGQLSLAKYLFMVAHEDNPGLDVRDVGGFFRHVLERVDWERDLHFHTRTTIDTLDYTGSGLNEGSKLVVAVAGSVRRELGRELPGKLAFFPAGISEPRVVFPGVVVFKAPAYREENAARADVQRLVSFFEGRFLGTDGEEDAFFQAFPLFVLADDSDFVSASLDNFLWVVFTRSDPASDTAGIGAFTHNKHWGCRHALIIDARRKPHHAPELEPDPQVAEKVRRMAAPGGPLQGLI